MPFKDTKEGQTNFCTHENKNPSGMCDGCIGNLMKVCTTQVEIADTNQNYVCTTEVVQKMKQEKLNSALLQAGILNK